MNEIKHALMNPFSGSNSLCGHGNYLTMVYEEVDCPDCLKAMKGDQFATSVAQTEALQANAEREWRQSDPAMARLYDLLREK